MKQDRYLPCDIIIDILSRLSVRTLTICKCVCKSWLDLLETPEFAKLHLSKSESCPGLAITFMQMWSIEMIEFEDGHNLHYTSIINLPFSDTVVASTDGLLLMKSDTIYLCNPITREYIDLNCSYHQDNIVAYGFGESKITGEYKVVMITHRQIFDHEEKYSLLSRVPDSDCKVYTIGTGSWRSIASDDLLNYTCSRRTSLVNGNLHWLAYDLKGSPLISCFDLETELFTTFSAPPLLSDSRPYCKFIVALQDCLCICDNTSEHEIVIWLMREYGVDKSWTRNFVISSPELHVDFGVFHPLKIFKDGDLFISFDNVMAQRLCFFYYSSKDQTIRRIGTPV